MAKTLGMDLTTGSIFKKMVKFSVPLIFTYWLQLAFNFADIIVLGAMVGDNAVAAVGSTSSLINLIIGLFTGLSFGANIMISKYLGENNQEKVRRTVGLSIIVSVVFGVVLLIIGQIFARTFLVWMNSPSELIDMSTLYLKVYFLGMPIRLLYNFCASILRASGETVKPMIFLLVGGVLNVGLNVFFISVVGLTVDGVAIATVMSELVSGILCIVVLIKNDGTVKLCKKYLRFYKEEFIEMIKQGVPSGIQGCLFSFSNVIIQSGINSFGEITVAGNSYASQIESFVYYAMYAFSVGIMSFVGQNYGVRNFKNVKKSIAYGVCLSCTVGIVLSNTCWILSQTFLSLLSGDPEVISVGMIRMDYICRFYFLCAIMEGLSFGLKGLGKSTTAMLITLFGTCVLRVLWVKIALNIYNSVSVIYVAYLITWVLTAIGHLIALMVLFKKIKKKLTKEEI